MNVIPVDLVSDLHRYFNKKLICSLYSPRPCPSLPLSQSRRACQPISQMHQKTPASEGGYVLAPREGGMGTIEGPPPLVITLLFCFAFFMIFIRICWSWRLGMTRTCRVNRMSKEEITFNKKIPRCPHLCRFQRRTSLNGKPWSVQEGTFNNVLWRGK